MAFSRLALIGQNSIDFFIAMGLMESSMSSFSFVLAFVLVFVLLHESELCTKVCGCYKESVSCCRLSETQGGPPWIVVFQKLNGNFVGRWIWRRLSIKSQVEPTLGQLGLNGASIIPIQDQSCLFLSLSVPIRSSDLGLWAVVNAIGDLQRYLWSLQWLSLKPTWPRKG